MAEDTERTGPLLRASYPSPAEFLAAFDAEIAKAGLLVRGASLQNATAMAECRVSVQVGEGAAIEVPARVAAVAPGLGVAVIFAGVPPALASLAQELRSPAGPEPESESEQQRGTLADRLKAMTVPQKMQLALSGTREERVALIKDLNKAVHVFVLKNPRIGVDEVQYAAKLPALSPDALKMIAEHREWSGNSAVCAALVRNPKTPLSIAVRLLDRIPMTDLRAIAKGGARDQIVHAARKKMAG